MRTQNPILFKPSSQSESSVHSFTPPFALPGLPLLWGAHSQIMKTKVKVNKSFKQEGDILIWMLINQCKMKQVTEDVVIDQIMEHCR